MIAIVIFIAACKNGKSEENQKGKKGSHIFMIHISQHTDFSVGPLSMNGSLEWTAKFLDGNILHP